MWCMVLKINYWSFQLEKPFLSKPGLYNYVTLIKLINIYIYYQFIALGYSQKKNTPSIVLWLAKEGKCNPS